MTVTRVVPGSARSELANTQVLGPVAGEEYLVVTLILRRRAELPGKLVTGPDTVTRDQLARHYGAAPDDASLVHEVLTRAGLEVQESDLGARRVRAGGKASRMSAMFGADLSIVHSSDPVTGATVRHRARSGDLRVSEELSGVVIAVLGLDDRPQVWPHSRLLRVTDQAAVPANAYLPTDLATAYDFPPGTDGDGQTLAIIELGGGFDQSDVHTYFAELGTPPPNVRAVGVDGTQNQPTGNPDSADREVLLDIEVAGALAPGTEQVVYFAPNTEQGFVDAVSAAVHASPTPTAVSISWGAPEDQWTEQARAAIDQVLADAAALGVTVCVASGDQGSSGGESGGAQVDFPASSPHALACGGTTLWTDSAGKATSETVWNSGQAGSTGGGISNAFPLPSYQATAGVPGRAGGGSGRGVPDVAADADPQTGYTVLVDGEWAVSGGTSAVAPLWAALLCRLGQALERRFGLVHTELYAGARIGKVQPGFRDVTVGDNGAYHAGPGWDACTGLGVPDGVALQKVLATAKA